MTPHPKALEAAARAMETACQNPTFRKCEKCGGSGYEHFMFEDGPSPDWCSVCGGNGYDFDDNEPLVAALTAYFDTLEKEGLIISNYVTTDGLDYWAASSQDDPEKVIPVTIIRHGAK